MLLRPCKPFIGVHDEHSGRVRWYLEQRRLQLPRELWAPFRTYGSRCLYTDSLEEDLAIDIYYTPDQPQPYRVEIFARGGDNREVAERLRRCRINAGMTWKETLLRDDNRCCKRGGKGERVRN